MRVTIDNGRDSLAFRDHRFHHRGEGWVTRLEGWYGSPGVDTDLQRVPGRDGSYPPGLYVRGSRVVTVGCAWRCMTDVEASMLMDRLNAIVAGPLTLSVEDPGGRRHATCHLTDQIEPTLSPQWDAVWFDLILTCPDPLRYGDPVLFTFAGGRCQVENQGNAATLPVVHATNPSGVGFVSVTDDSGHEVAWEGDGSATEVTLDFSSLNPGVGAVTRDDAFPIRPGIGTVYATATSGSSITMTVNPAWR